MSKSNYVEVIGLDTTSERQNISSSKVQDIDIGHMQGIGDNFDVVGGFGLEGSLQCDSRAGINSDSETNSILDSVSVVPNIIALRSVSDREDPTVFGKRKGKEIVGGTTAGRGDGEELQLPSVFDKAIHQAEFKKKHRGRKVVFKNISEIGG